MIFKTELIGQNYIEEIFNKILDDTNDIPHIFISGCNGSGKTTLLKEFIDAYFKKHLIKNKSEWIMNLSSEKDRGIHCVRQNVTEFVHHTSAKQGVYRWILIDDADSLPIISQQALRRPMETHAHTTRFFFCSRYSSDLIHPLRSRCLHTEVESISPFDLIDHFLKKNSSKQALTPEAYSFIMTLVKSPSQIKSIINILSNYYITEEVISLSLIHI
jgi:DNA polymerase III delta prime subunit